MQERQSAAALLEASAAHIETTGLLGGSWLVTFTGEEAPCGCLVGVVRHVAGLPARPRQGIGNASPETVAMVAAALLAFSFETADHRAEIAEAYNVGTNAHPVHGDDVPVAMLSEYSDVVADVMAKSWKGHRVRQVLWGGTRDEMAGRLRQAAKLAARQ